MLEIIKLVLFLSGIFLIADAVFSIIYRQEDKVLKKKFARLYQPGRYIRGMIGVLNIITSCLL